MKWAQLFGISVISEGRAHVDGRGHIADEVERVIGMNGLRGRGEGADVQGMEVFEFGDEGRRRNLGEVVCVDRASSVGGSHDRGWRLSEAGFNEPHCVEMV